MKKAVFLSLILFTGIPISCIYGPFGSEFRIEALDVSVGQFQVQDDFASFIEVAYNQGNGDTLSVSKLVIEISISETSNVASRISLGLTPSAFADPAPPRAESELSLISIYAEESIFADGVAYEAGENLTPLFSLASSYYNEPMAVLNFIDQFEGWDQSDQLYLTFTTAIDQPIAQPFKIDVTLENGMVFELETEKVVVN